MPHSDLVTADSSFAAFEAEIRNRTRQRFLTTALVYIVLFIELAVFYANPSWTAQRELRELVLWVALFGMLALYGAGYFLMRNNKIPRTWMVPATLVLTLAVIAIPPFHSTDVFGYINRGWQQWHYQLNPYVDPIDAIPGWEQDPMITNHWVNNPSPYGFLYMQIAKWLVPLGLGSKEATLLAFKLFNLLIYWLTAMLVWLGVSRLQPDSDNGPAMRALYLFAWNPLILIHIIANSHNDLLMGGLITLAGLLAVLGSTITGSWLWLLPVLTAATLVKYAAVVILPFALLWLVKRRNWQALAGGITLSLLLVALTGAPYLADWRHIPLAQIGRNATVSHGSLHAALLWFHKVSTKAIDIHLYLAQEKAVRNGLKWLLFTGYGAFYAWLFLKRRLQKEYPLADWLQDALLVMAVLIMAASLKFYPWYLGMFLPLALFLPERHWLRQLVIAVSCGQMLSITLIGQAHFLNFVLMTVLPIVLLLILRRIRLRKPPEPLT